MCADIHTTPSAPSDRPDAATPAIARHAGDPRHRLRPAVADFGQAAPRRAARRRPAPPAPTPRDDPALSPPGGPRPRTGALRPGRARLSARRRRLAADATEGRGRRTGARITKALNGASSAADISPNACALARGRPRHRNRRTRGQVRQAALDFHPPDVPDVRSRSLPGFGGWERPPTLALHDLQLRPDVTGGVEGCQSSVMTTLPLARPCSTYASASRVWSNGNALSMTGRSWPPS
jgi:hypothetical protein